MWRRVPTIVRAVLTGLAVAAAGTIPWALLSVANGRVLVALPWAVILAAGGLWLYWRYLGGAGWPASTSARRRELRRANKLDDGAWGMALFAGMLGLMTILPLTGLMSRLVRLPAEAQSTKVPAGMPFGTLFILLVMASVVAGVVEETAFRGYMQLPIERRHGPVVAILVNGVVFGLAHFSHHPAAVVIMLPYYVVLTAIWGGLAYITNSTLPGMVLHVVGDVFSLTRLFTTGLPEWQTSSAPPPLVWESGPDAAFWGYLTALIVLGAATVWAYVALAELLKPGKDLAQVEHNALLRGRDIPHDA